jgi:hypothetical protein
LAQPLDMVFRPSDFLVGEEDSLWMNKGDTTLLAARRVTPLLREICIEAYDDVGAEGSNSKLSGVQMTFKYSLEFSYRPGRGKA